MKPIHLSGMGVVGSFLARQLARHGISFTWEDSDTPLTAWRASTGAIYPTGEPLAGPAHVAWPEWADAVGVGYERALFWFNTKSPPNGSKYPTTKAMGGMKTNPAHNSYHVDIPAMVGETRAMFSEQRREAEPGALWVTSRAAPQDTGHWLWGWSCRARSPELARYALGGLRGCLYVRTWYHIAYLYPVPNTDEYFFGTAIILQKRAAERDVEPTLNRALRLFTEATGLAPELIGAATQGWRPAMRPECAHRPLAWQEADGIHIRPMGSSGVRLAPTYTKAVLELL